MGGKIILIGCGIFQEEVEHLLREAGGRDMEIIWLEPGLHENVEKLEEALAEEAAKLRRLDGAANVGLLYGMACLPAMKNFVAAQELTAFGPRNCIAAMVGDEKLKELERDRTLVATPAWVRKMWGRPDGWQAADFRMNFGRYDRILILDAGLSPLTDEEIITCFDLVGVPLEVMECGLDHFRLAFRKLIEAVEKTRTPL